MLLAALLLAPGLAVMDGFMTIVAAPSVGAAMQADGASVQLILAARVVAYAGLLVVGGRLGDVFGRRRFLVGGLALFAVSSSLTASATTLGALILGRCLQGAAAALMYPQALALIRVHFHGHDLNRAMAGLGATLGLAALAAQLVGGLVIQSNFLGAGWRAVFLIDVTVSALAAAVVALLVPRDPQRAGGYVDVHGGALLTAGLVALVLPLTMGRELAWPIWAWLLLASSGLLAATFVWHEKRMASRGPAALIAIDLLRFRPMIIGLAATLTLYGGQLSLWLLLTVYLQNGLGLTPLATGLTFTPVGLGLLLASTAMSGLRRTCDQKLLIAGAIGLAVGVCGLALVALPRGGPSSVGAMLPVLFLIGVSFGVAIPALIGRVVRLLPSDEASAGSGLLVTTQQLAGAVGIALTGTVFFGMLARISYGAAFAATVAFQVPLYLCTALLGWALRR